MPIISDAAPEPSLPQQQQVQEARPAAATPSYDEQYAQAKALADSGQSALAVEAWTLLLARSPGNADVLLGRGLAYARQQRWAQAEADLTAATVAAPGYADVWSSLGDVYRWSGQPAKAVAAYDRVLVLNPGDSAAMASRATAERALDAPAAPAASATAAAAPAAATRSAQLEPGLQDGYAWAAGLSASFSQLSTQDDTWNEQTASVRRYFERGSLGFETLRAERFGRSDLAWALDAYTQLWPRAYANLRYQRAPSERLFPGSSWRAELFQGVGAGWELSVSKDSLGFDGGTVDINGFSVAKYIGNFYLVARRQNILSPGSHSTGHRLLGRYYYKGDADSYVELSHSRGRGDDALSLIGGRTRSGSTSASLVNYFAPNWSYKIGASYARESNGGNERSLSMSVGRRW